MAKRSRRSARGGDLYSSFTALMLIATAFLRPPF
jgi:hypothetical protein